MLVFTLCVALSQTPLPPGQAAPPAAQPVAFAQPPASAAQPGAQAPAAGAPDVIVEDADDEAYRIGKVIRCPLCQGMSIAESPSPIARGMMNTVRELLAQGKNQEEIIAYFERSYGEFVRLEPQTHGVNILVYILPPALLLAGIIGLLVASRRRAGSRPAPEEAAPTPVSLPSETSADAYLQAVRDEVQ